MFIEKINKEKGVSLIITFFIMIIVLAIVISISVLLYSEVKVIRNMGDSVASFYAAESGTEKVLYYDRQVVPEGAARGLCAMLNPRAGTSYCSDANDASADSSIYCDGPKMTPGVAGGCDIASCANCTIEFNTIFDNRKYNVTAANINLSDGTAIYLDTLSKGEFGGASRAIEIYNTSK